MSSVAHVLSVLCVWTGKVNHFVPSVMTTLEEFLRAPSEELLERCSREQLVRIAEHFRMDVSDRRLKENVKNILKENLLEAGVLQPKLDAGGSGVETADVSVSEVGEYWSTGLTFEQRKELLLLQVEIKIKKV